MSYYVRGVSPEETETLRRNLQARRGETESADVLTAPERFFGGRFKTLALGAVIGIGIGAVGVSLLRKAIT